VNTWLKRLMQTMQPIKTITNRDPMFLKTAYKYDSLVNLQNDERFISVGEKYISYNGHWNVYKMTKGRLPRLCGRFDSLHRAVYRARLSV
jgi:hypothetical protein